MMELIDQGGTRVRRICRSHGVFDGKRCPSCMAERQKTRDLLAALKADMAQFYAERERQRAAAK